MRCSAVPLRRVDADLKRAVHQATHKPTARVEHSRTGHPRTCHIGETAIFAIGFPGQLITVSWDVAWLTTQAGPVLKLPAQSPAKPSAGREFKLGASHLPPSGRQTIWARKQMAHRVAGTRRNAPDGSIGVTGLSTANYGATSMVDVPTLVIVSGLLITIDGPGSTYWPPLR